MPQTGHCLFPGPSSVNPGDDSENENASSISSLWNTQNRPLWMFNIQIKSSFFAQSSPRPHGEMHWLVSISLAHKLFVLTSNWTLCLIKTLPLLTRDFFFSTRLCSFSERVLFACLEVLQTIVQCFVPLFFKRMNFITESCITGRYIIPHL